MNFVALRKEETSHFCRPSIRQGYWRFSDSVFPDEEGFSSSCPLTDYRCACVVTDLSKYAGGLEVLQSVQDSTCAVSLEISTHPTLEAGEKHDTTKLLYDAVFSGSTLGLRCAVPRGSQLDLGTARCICC